MIWNHIEAKSARMGVRSETGAMKDLSDRYRVDDESLSESIPHQKNQVGYLAFVHDGFAGGDIFPSLEISKRKFHKLVRSYYLDSRDPMTTFPRVSPDEIMNQIKSTQMETVATVGSGDEMRFEGANLQGSLTLFQKDLAHLTVFPKQESKRGTGRGLPRMFDR